MKAVTWLFGSMWEQQAKGGVRMRGCGFAEFLSGERSIGFCLDKAQLSGRPVQIQDCPGLQEVLVGEESGFFLLFFFHPAHFSLLGGFQRMQSMLRVGFFLCVLAVGVFLPWYGGDSLVHLCSDINNIKKSHCFHVSHSAGNSSLAHLACRTITDAHPATHTHSLPCVGFGVESITLATFSPPDATPQKQICTLCSWSHFVWLYCLWVIVCSKIRRNKQRDGSHSVRSGSRQGWLRVH